MSSFIKTVLFIFMLSSCTSDSEINGIWRVNDMAYEATYEIKNFSNKKKALILKYDDGTTRFSIKDKKIFFFNNIIKRKGNYIDAISGATKTEGNQNALKLIHADTLEVTTYIMNKAVKENWIRSIK